MVLIKAITGIKNNPDNRRMIVSGWNVADLQSLIAGKKTAPPPCHTMFQFYVANNKLSCQLYQRSADYISPPVRFSSLDRLLAGGSQNLIVPVPSWAAWATNVLLFATNNRTGNPANVGVLFDHTNLPTSYVNAMFWPPKPKLLVRIVSQRASRALFGT